MTTDPHQILVQILISHQDNPNWIGQPFERIKRISNTKVGDVGQEFMERYLSILDCHYELPNSRQSPWDIRIMGKTFEIKTASEDVGGAFQFNHIRYHREYDALLCVGISPANIHAGIWSKADVATGAAGKLVTMEKGANASYKLTKRPDQLFPVTDLKQWLDQLIRKL